MKDDCYSALHAIPDDINNDGEGALACRAC